MGRPLILTTNDDGIDAAGLRALEAALREDGEIHLVAPVGAMSQCGHRITTHECLPVYSRGERRHAVEGTPADCVRLAFTHLLPRRPDWVFSGANQGGDLGADIYVSGTVAAVREAAFLGVRGAAISQYHRRGEDIDWEWTLRCVREVIGELMEAPLGEGEHWNVNLLHVDPREVLPERVICRPSRRSLPVSFQSLPHVVEGERHFLYDGVYADRLRKTGSGIEVCFGGRVAVSKLKLH